MAWVRVRKHRSVRGVCTSFSPTPKYSKPQWNWALAIWMDSFLRVSCSLGKQTILMKQSQAKTLLESTLLAINFLTTSLWCTKSVMACSNFFRRSFFRSATTLVASTDRKFMRYFSTASSFSPPPSMRASSTFLLQRVCSPSSTTWAGFFSMILSSPSLSWSLSSSTLVMSFMTSSRKVASDMRISLSTLVSQTLILGSSVMLTGFLSSTISPSLLAILRMRSWVSVFSFWREVMPAYILVKCFWTMPTSLLLPMISRRSSSPTKQKRAKAARWVSRQSLRAFWMLESMSMMRVRVFWRPWMFMVSIMLGLDDTFFIREVNSASMPLKRVNQLNSISFISEEPRKMDSRQTHLRWTSIQMSRVRRTFCSLSSHWTISSSKARQYCDSFMLERLLRSSSSCSNISSHPLMRLHLPWQRTSSKSRGSQTSLTLASMFSSTISPTATAITSLKTVSLRLRSAFQRCPKVTSPCEARMLSFPRRVFQCRGFMHSSFSSTIFLFMLQQLPLGTATFSFIASKGSFCFSLVGVLFSSFTASVSISFILLRVTAVISVSLMFSQGCHTTCRWFHTSRSSYMSSRRFSSFCMLPGSSPSRSLASQQREQLSRTLLTRELSPSSRFSASLGATSTDPLGFSPFHCPSMSPILSLRCFSSESTFSRRRPISLSSWPALRVQIWRRAAHSIMTLSSSSQSAGYLQRCLYSSLLELSNFSTSLDHSRYLRRMPWNSVTISTMSAERFWKLIFSSLALASCTLLKKPLRVSPNFSPKCPSISLCQESYLVLILLSTRRQSMMIGPKHCSVWLLSKVRRFSLISFSRACHLLMSSPSLSYILRASITHSASQLNQILMQSQAARNTLKMSRQAPSSTSEGILKSTASQFSLPFSFLMSEPWYLSDSSRCSEQMNPITLWNSCAHTNLACSRGGSRKNTLFQDFSSSRMPSVTYCSPSCSSLATKEVNSLIQSLTSPSRRLAKMASSCRLSSGTQTWRLETSRLLKSSMISWMSLSLSASTSSLSGQVARDWIVAPMISYFSLTRPCSSCSSSTTSARFLEQRSTLRLFSFQKVLKPSLMQSMTAFFFSATSLAMRSSILAETWWQEWMLSWRETTKGQKSMRVLPVHSTLLFLGWMESKLRISLIRLMYFCSKLTATSQFFFLTSRNSCFRFSSLLRRMFAVSLSHSFIIVSVLSFFSRASILFLHSRPSGCSAQFSIRISLIFSLYFSSLFLICLAHTIDPAFIGRSRTLQIFTFSVSTQLCRNFRSSRFMLSFTVFSSWLWYSSIADFILGRKNSPLNFEKMRNISLAEEALPSFSRSRLVMQFSATSIWALKSFSACWRASSPSLLVSSTLTPLNCRQPSSMLVVDRKSFSPDFVMMSSITVFSLWYSQRIRLSCSRRVLRGLQWYAVRGWLLLLLLADIMRLSELLVLRLLMKALMLSWNFLKISSAFSQHALKPPQLPNIRFSSPRILCSWLAMSLLSTSISWQTRLLSQPSRAVVSLRMWERMGTSTLRSQSAVWEVSSSWNFISLKKPLMSVALTVVLLRAAITDSKAVVRWNLLCFLSTAMQNLTSSLSTWLSTSLRAATKVFQYICSWSVVELIRSNWCFSSPSMSRFHFTTSSPILPTSSALSWSGLASLRATRSRTWGLRSSLTQGTVTISWHWAMLKLSSPTLRRMLEKVVLSEVAFFSNSFLQRPSSGIMSLLTYWKETLSGSDSAWKSRLTTCSISASLKAVTSLGRLKLLFLISSTLQLLSTSGPHSFSTRTSPSPFVTSRNRCEKSEAKADSRSWLRSRWSYASRAACSVCRNSQRWPRYWRRVASSSLPTAAIPYSIQFKYVHGQIRRFKRTPSPNNPSQSTDIMMKPVRALNVTAPLHALPAHLQESSVNYGGSKVSARNGHSRSIHQSYLVPNQIPSPLASKTPPATHEQLWALQERLANIHEHYRCLLAQQKERKESQSESIMGLIDELGQTHAQKVGSLRGLIADSQSSKKEIGMVDEKMTEIKSNIDDLIAQSNTLKAQNQHLEEQIQHRQELNRGRERELEELNEELLQAREELEGFERANLKNNRVKREINELFALAENGSAP